MQIYMSARTIRRQFCIGRLEEDSEWCSGSLYTVVTELKPSSQLLVLVLVPRVLPADSHGLLAAPNLCICSYLIAMGVDVNGANQACEVGFLFHFSFSVPSARHLAESSMKAFI